MIIPENIENLAELVKGPEKTVFFFTAGWCGDCNFIKPKMPEIEVENPDFKFVEVDRDEYIDLAIEWGIMGIPSFVVIEDGKEKARLVNKLRKTKEEVNTFLASAK
ncbi:MULTISPECIES: thioredoxin family protein [Lactococcus]|jgi:thiol-disulfide isomerase/thioredoxin|uniref:thioredoxin family protein n=1 Tax=Lactococcus TaxID=1357 RepID=UPI00024D8E82|nr:MULTISPECIES: thioredoxin family protein [Lactococcus]MCA2381041.1 thioredoxin family protein [Lactococcus sp. SK2-659]MCI2094409.1 thioredoxin family protein [Lactococcus lactis]MCI2190446.1 thioredoxin family protein [Lactococcus lactis]MDR2058908.1 thioredoxin family protein [Lactococcus lactis]THA55294.1 thioredoxin [Lactococcus lactis]